MQGHRTLASGLHLPTSGVSVKSVLQLAALIDFMSCRSSIIVCAFIGFNLAIAAWRILAAGSQWRGRGTSSRSRPHSDLTQILIRVLALTVSYSDINYPLHLPVPPTDPVVMSLHESARFTLAHNDTVGDDEWASILYYAAEGRIQFGPEHRAFMPAYFHQFHCLRGLQRSIVFPGDRGDVNQLKGPDEHVQHCLNYLRQTFLCNAAESIERGDFMTGRLEVGTFADELVCENWEAVFDAMMENHAEFMEWNAKWN